MNYRYFVAFLLIGTTVSSHLHAENKPAWEDKNRDQAWFKKRLKAAENIDKFITALLMGSGTVWGTTRNETLNQFAELYNPLPIKVRHASPSLTVLLGAGKFGMTLRRMYLHDRYVGWNPFKMIPSMAYFVIVDMASWASK